MMTQLRILLLIFLGFGILLSGFPVLAADEVVVICDSSCSTPEFPLQALSWAPGSSWEERVVVDNRASISRDLQGELEVAGGSELISLLTASWKNGSHKVLQLGSLVDVVKATSLGTVPPKSKRVFYLTVTLPKNVDNAAQNKRFRLNASLKITDAPKTVKAVSSKRTPTNTKSTTSGVLGVSLSHASYPLPTLGSRVLSSAPIQAADQLVQAARRQLWWGWLIVAIEVMVLMPWRFRIVSMWQRLILEMVSIILAGLLSGWLAALAASLWLCVDLGRLSAKFTEGPSTSRLFLNKTPFALFPRRRESGSSTPE